MSSQDSIQHGTIKFFEETKKFGFILPENGEKDIFFHISGVGPDDKDDFNKDCKDRKCTYTLFKGQKGIEAENIELV